MQINTNDFNVASRGPGSMGPPSKPADRAKEEDVNIMDVLGGTGVDIREEEQYMYQSFNSQQSRSPSRTISASHSFTQFPPGDERSFYGAGPANAAPEQANGMSQDEYEKKAADKAWHDAARRIVVSRAQEFNDPFLETSFLHLKISNIAREHGLTVYSAPGGAIGHFVYPDAFPQSTVNLRTALGPDGAVVATNGQFLPTDTGTVDQIALLSLATKQRMRSFLEEAATIAKGRQTGSHGIIPDEWTDVAAPASLSTAVPEGSVRLGWESAVSPHSSPLKRKCSLSFTPIMLMLMNSRLLFSCE